MNAAQLQKLFDAAGVQHFTATRFLTLRQTGQVVDLPDDYAAAAVAVVQQADTLRNRYGAPVKLANGYRPTWYNEKVGGAPKSQHRFGAAVDLDPLDGRKAEFQALAAQLWMERPDEIAGLGVYSGGRVHLDVFNAAGDPGRRSWPKDSDLRVAALSTAKTLDEPAEEHAPGSDVPSQVAQSDQRPAAGSGILAALGAVVAAMFARDKA